jgi:hypothetical protein
MAKKAFNFVSFDPMLWDSGPAADPSFPILEVQQLAPQGAPRATLKTRIFRRPNTPHDAFDAFNGRHDVVKRLEAYAPTGDDGTESDNLQEQIYVQPLELHAYQFHNNPTQLYATASDLIIKAIFQAIQRDNKRLQRYSKSTGGRHRRFGEKPPRNGNCRVHAA